MSTSPRSSDSAVTWRLLLPAVLILVVLGFVLLNTFLRWEDHKPVAQSANPIQATPKTATGEQKSPSQTASSAATALSAPPAVPTLSPPAPHALTKADDQAPAIADAAPPVIPPSSQASSQSRALTDLLPATTALAPGEPALARVSVGGVSTPPLAPNQINTFPRVYLPPGGQADVQVQLPEASPGDQVLAGAEDGGHFANGQSVAALTVDANHAVAFQFQVGQFPGNYRITVRHQAQSKTVLLWAGDRALAANR